MYDAIVMSDIHLGLDVCRAKEVTAFLELIHSGEIQTDRLILNGDVFDSHDFRRLRKSHWKVLSEMRKLSDEMEIVWISGNHDGPADIISHLLGVSVVDEYIFESGEKDIMLFHGDRYDNFLTDHPVITWLADAAYSLVSLVDKGSYLCKRLKQSSKTYLRCSEIIEKKAIAYARKNHADVVCCGHTHQIWQSENDDVSYFNSGCWTELPCHYLTIAKGNVQIVPFS